MQGKYFINQRSLDTFRPISEYQGRWVNELAVDYSVPDIAELMTSVEECTCQWNNGKPTPKILKRLWP